jgi:hypothetical protein
MTQVHPVMAHWRLQVAWLHCNQPVSGFQRWQFWHFADSAQWPAARSLPAACSLLASRARIIRLAFHSAFGRDRRGFASRCRQSQYTRWETVFRKLLALC